MDDVQLAAAREMTTRTREAMGPWLTELRPWPWFVTFTYDAVKVLRARGVNARRGSARLARAVDADGPSIEALSVTVGVQKMRRDMSRFVAESARAEGRTLDLVAGFEPHLSGSLHAHGLAFFRGAATGHEITSMHGAWYARNGALQVQRVASAEELAAYVVKNVVQYCTKGAADLFFSGRLSDERY